MRHYYVTDCNNGNDIDKIVAVFGDKIKSMTDYDVWFVLNKTIEGIIHNTHTLERLQKIASLIGKDTILRATKTDSLISTGLPISIIYTLLPYINNNLNVWWITHILKYSKNLENAINLLGVHNILKLKSTPTEIIDIIVTRQSANMSQTLGTLIPIFGKEYLKSIFQK